MSRDACEAFIADCIQQRDYARKIGDKASEEAQQNRLHSLRTLLARFGPAKADEAVIVG